MSIHASTTTVDHDLDEINAELQLAADGDSETDWFSNNGTGTKATKPKPDARNDPFGPDTWNDKGNADRFIDLHGNDVLHCHPWHAWLTWDGSRWAVDDVGAIIEKAKTVPDRIQREAYIRGGEDKLFKFGTQSANTKRLADMLSLARSSVPVLPDDLNQHPMLFNVANGTIDLETCTLREHRRSDRLTTICKTAYLPDAKCPRWDQFVLEIFAGNAELAGYWQRLCGYSLIGKVTEHVLPILYGTGNNGKSTCIDTLISVIGLDYADACSPDLFLTSGSREHKTIVADLFGKRLVFANETEDSHRLNESQVKRITGDDRIKARRMREDLWGFAPSHTAFLATNHKPEVRGSDHGIWRRIKLIPFNVRFGADRADPDLKDKLIAEAEGILAWCVRGCRDWLREGLREPSIVSNATKDYRDREDVLAQFINDQCVTGMEQFKVKASKFREALKSWCESEGLDAPGQKTIGTFVESSADLESFKSNGTWYRYIALRHDSEFSERHIGSLD